MSHRMAFTPTSNFKNDYVFKAVIKNAPKTHWDHSSFRVQSRLHPRLHQPSLPGSTYPHGSTGHAYLQSWAVPSSYTPPFFTGPSSGNYNSLSGQSIYPSPSNSKYGYSADYSSYTSYPPLYYQSPAAQMPFLGLQPTPPFTPDYNGYPRSSDNANSSNRFSPTLSDRQIDFVETFLHDVHQEKPAIEIGSWPSAPYRYSGLSESEVRLFVLFPGVSVTQLRGCVWTFSLAGNIQFRALSYVWGNNVQSQSRVETVSGTILISDSLAAALKRLRSKRDAVILWIDAICIDQKNNLEKAQQIRLLPKIFQKASSTIAMVANDNTSEAAVETLLQIQAQRVYGAGNSQWPEKLPEVPLSWLGRPTPPSDHPIWKEIDTLFERSWFRRAWIVQEAVVARTMKMICGKWTFDWQDLSSAIDIIDRELDVPATTTRAWSPFKTIAKLKKWERRGRRFPLISLLETFRYNTSTLQRDRLFALLGLAEDGNLDAFEPDYAGSLDEIVMRFTMAMIENGDPIQILYRAGLSSQPDRFPSWVPDWTVIQARSLSALKDRGTDFKACKRETPVVKAIALTRGLQVEGYEVDEIVQISVASNGPSLVARAALFAEIDVLLESKDVKGVYTPQQRHDLKWQVPALGAKQLPGTSTSQINVPLCFKAFRRIVHRTRPQNQEDNESERINEIHSNEEARAYNTLLADAGEGWKFITTRSQRCGLVPPNSMKGDFIALFRGGVVPFVVRKNGDAGTWRLIGECYVDGIMYGEAMREEVKPKPFILV